MVAQPQDNSGEDDMEPLPSAAPEDTSGSGEPDDSPLPSSGDGNIDHGKGMKNPNGTLCSLGAGSPYKGCN